MVSKNVNQTEVEEATRLDLNAVRFHSDDIVASLDGLDVDHLGALAVSSLSVGRWRRVNISNNKS